MKVVEDQFPLRDILTMKLYVDSNYLSPYAMSAFIALREKCVPFEMALVNLQRSEHMADGYAGISAMRRIPAISDNGFNLAESSAICEYIDDCYPGPALYPASIQAKAKAREIQAWLRSDLMPIREERSTEGIFMKRSPPQLSSAAQAAAQKLFLVAERLLPANAQNLFGEWSIADTDLALMLNRLICAEDEVPERLSNFAKYQWQRTSVQEWVSMDRPML